MTSTLQNHDSALLIVDMLEDYFDAGLWPESALPGLRERLVRNQNRLIASCRTAGLPIVWIRQEFEPDLGDAFPHMVRKGVSYTIKDTTGAEILEELDRQDDDPVIIKKRFSAFFRTSLLDDLTSLGVSNLFIAGITSSWCVRATAVDAYQLGYNVNLIREAIGGFSEDSNTRSLNEMDGYIADVESLDSVCDRMSVLSDSVPSSQ